MNQIQIVVIVSFKLVPNEWNVSLVCLPLSAIVVNWTLQIVDVILSVSWIVRTWIRATFKSVNFENLGQFSLQLFENLPVDRSFKALTKFFWVRFDTNKPSTSKRGKTNLDTRWRARPNLRFCRFAVQRFVLSSYTQKLKCTSFQELSTGCKINKKKDEECHLKWMKTLCTARRWRSSLVNEEHSAYFVVGEKFIISSHQPRFSGQDDGQERGADFDSVGTWTARRLRFQFFIFYRRPLLAVKN